MTMTLTSGHGVARATSTESATSTQEAPTSDSQPAGALSRKLKRFSFTRHADRNVRLLEKCLSLQTYAVKYGTTDEIWPKVLEQFWTAMPTASRAAIQKVSLTACQKCHKELLGRSTLERSIHDGDEMVSRREELVRQLKVEVKRVESETRRKRKQEEAKTHKRKSQSLSLRDEWAKLVDVMTSNMHISKRQNMDDNVRPSDHQTQCGLVKTAAENDLDREADEDAGSLQELAPQSSENAAPVNVTEPLRLPATRKARERRRILEDLTNVRKERTDLSNMLRTSIEEANKRACARNDEVMEMLQKPHEKIK